MKHVRMDGTTVILLKFRSIPRSSKYAMLTNICACPSAQTSVPPSTAHFSCSSKGSRSSRMIATPQESSRCGLAALSHVLCLEAHDNKESQSLGTAMILCSLSVNVFQVIFQISIFLPIFCDFFCLLDSSRLQPNRNHFHCRAAVNFIYLPQAYSPLRQACQAQKYFQKNPQCAKDKLSNLSMPYTSSDVLRMCFGQRMLFVLGRMIFF